MAFAVADAVSNENAMLTEMLERAQSRISDFEKVVEIMCNSMFTSHVLLR